MNPRHIVIAAVGTFAFATTSFAQQMPDSHVVPLKQSAVGATNKRIEAVHGDRTKAGEPFVIRIHAEAGFVIMPHTHPVDENIVVLAGSWALGMGDHFDASRLTSMDVGDFGFAGANMRHFAFSKTDTIIQVHGTGAFWVKWVQPIYELTDHGVLKRERAEDAGTPTDAPKGCFTMKLGDAVRGAHGEGKIIGAQCTPGELTQYRVEKQDGSKFWDRPEALTALH